MRDPKYRWWKVELLGPDWKLQPIYFRSLTAGEGRQQQRLPPEKAEVFILKHAVYGGESIDWDRFPGGASRTLLQCIYGKSGMGEDEDGSVWDQALNWLKTDFGKLEAVAVTMIPGLTFEVLENCDSLHYAKYLFIGKHNFETMYNIPVSEAFNFEPQTKPAEVRRPAQTVPPRPGEVVWNTEEEYSWRAGQPITIDPDAVDLDDVDL